MRKISVVMIVKNESALLRKCLDSVKGADELVVVDTGSSDDTVLIAQSYGARIEHFPWADDFAQARNFAKGFARYGWVLSIDADEVLSEGGIETLKKRIIGKDTDAMSVDLFNGVASHVNGIRFFRRKLDWKGKIHECIEAKKTEASGTRITYGRSPAHDLDPDLDLRIMQKVAEEEPENSRNMFYLGREYVYYGKYDLAIETFERYLEISLFYAERTEAYFLLAQCYWRTGKGAVARERCMSAIVYNPHFKAAILFMAEMCFDREKARWTEFAKNADNSQLLFVS